LSLTDGEDGGIFSLILSKKFCYNKKTKKKVQNNENKEDYDNETTKILKITITRQ